jgi:6-pyruvoyltetrahydropterin/6-carboxytetrahydropterin synthase
MKVGMIQYIDCAHYLPGHKKCGSLHGHTYKVEVVIEGEVKDGMLMDFGDMKEVLQEILAEYDHRSWNDYLDYPSVENICLLLEERLRERLPYSFMIRVWEGEGKWAELSSTRKGEER